MPTITTLPNNVDSVMAAVMNYCAAVQGSLLRNYTFSGNYINPGIVHFQNRLLLAAGTAWLLPSVPQLNDGQLAYERIFFRWLNHSSVPFTGVENYLNVSSLKLAEIRTKIVGPDPRMVAISDDKLVIAFTYRFTRPHVRMGTVEISYVAATKSLEVTKLHLAIPYPSRSDEKNWSPFAVEHVDSSSKGTASRVEGSGQSDSHESSAKNPKDVYFIQSINPMHIVHFDFTTNETVTISQAPTAFHSYAYGSLRGGTNAIHIGDGVYLSIFHSLRTLPYNSLHTYFMGAYTFRRRLTNEHGWQWRLEAMSSQPIVDAWLYDGSYDPFARNRRVDYCLFPTSLLFAPSSTGRPTGNRNATMDDEKHSKHSSSHRRTEHRQLLLSFGRQDSQGFVAYLDLHQLLKSLEPVTYCDEPDTNSGHPFPSRHQHHCDPNLRMF